MWENRGVMIKRSVEQQSSVEKDVNTDMNDAGNPRSLALGE